MFDYGAVEYATADGMNEKGLAVNALFDSDCTYEQLTTNSNVADISLFKPEVSRLSTLRYAQYILDSFDSVKQAVEQIKADIANDSYVLYDQGMPDSSGLKATFHFALSDSSGDSAIVEFRKGKPVISHSCKYRVVTNQPEYKAQMMLNEYWQYQWGKSHVASDNALYTAPGGKTPTQRFERASFYLTFTMPATKLELVVAQTRSLQGSVATPIKCNLTVEQKDGEYIVLDDHESYTIWTNLASHQDTRYYLLNTHTMNAVYLNTKDCAEKLTQCVDIMKDGSQEIQHDNDLHGNVSAYLQDTKDPYAYV